MRNSYSRVLSLTVGALAVMLGASDLPADDTEIFISQPASTVQSNILLVIDTSGSMNETAGTSPVPFDPNESYNDGPANCNSSRVYYSSSSTAPNDCDGLNWFPLSDLKCAKALVALDSGSGYYSDRYIRWGGSGSNRAWSSSLNPNNAGYVECLEDEGTHGESSGSSAKYPMSGSHHKNSYPDGRWTSTASSSWWGISGNTGLARTLYSANYIRYVRNGSTSIQTRMEVVKAAAASLLNSLPNVNLGVARFDAGGAQGGMIMSPISPLDTKRAQLIADITTSNQYEPYGNTPLSETLFEAYRYFSGGQPRYGNGTEICTNNNASPGSTGSCSNSNVVDFPSVSASKSGSNYISPAAEPCQANYIVYLTDGQPTSDNDADNSITGLPNFGTLAGTGCEGSGSGRCLGALSEYMHNADLRSDVQGQQNVSTFYIGFGAAFSGVSNSSYQYLQTAANRGGGQAYQANDLTGLTAVFNSIITSIFQTSTTFTTPTVAVNAFNRTQTLSDLFVSVFQPNSSLHWPGNLKKYRVEEGVIMDNSSPSKAAVDPLTGFFSDGARSYWSGGADGSQVQEGGAASQLPGAVSRKLYTYLGANPATPATLSSSLFHAVDVLNLTLTSGTLNLGTPGDPLREELILWARGLDSRNEDGDAATLVRKAMGDPLHSPPAVVIYGGTTSTPDIDDAAVYVTTNDGYLHAIDSSSGNELWSFIPQEFLGNLKNLYFDDPVPAKQYTLDGEIRVLRYDINGDGIISSAAGDRVILYFGQARGGDNYYALDVTSKNAPKFMWTIGPSQLPGIGQTWSPPVITRVNINGATQNSQKLALVFGGGYDPAEDGTIYLDSSGVGNRIFIVDALRGTRLWSAGPASSGANFENARMTHSIPSGVTVLDTDSDGYADRMYVGDMGAQLWRFDLTNGNNAGSLAAGGVIASLGTHDDLVPVPTNARRFYSAPDVAALRRSGGSPFMNIAIGSGFRGHPLNTLVQDRFYSIRDHKPFTRMTQQQYSDFTANSLITDAGLQDITTDVSPSIPANSLGWKLLLNAPDWRGEKSLSASNTFNNAIFFTTYTPPNGTSATSCGASTTGSNRAYVVNVFNGAPLPRHDGETGGEEGGEGGSGGNDGGLLPEDRYDDLRQGGIAPEVAFLFPSKDVVVCLSGVEVLGACRNFNSRVKTYWRENGAN